MKKDVFVDKHKQSDIVENWEQFLKIMKKLEPYLVKFKEDSIIKAKNYLSDCKIVGNKRWPIIVITYDEYMFLSNNSISKA